MKKLLLFLGLILCLAGEARAGFISQPGGGSETDPVVGAITGIPVGDGAGNVGTAAAEDLPYTPTTGADWADPDPEDVKTALDTLAALIAGNAVKLVVGAWSSTECDFAGQWVFATDAHDEEPDRPGFGGCLEAGAEPILAHADSAGVSSIVTPSGTILTIPGGTQITFANGTGISITHSGTTITVAATGSAGLNILHPYSAYHVSGACSFDIYNSQEKLYVADTAANLAADCILRLRFQLPPTLPSGTLKALVTARANATANNGAFAVKWSVTAPEADEVAVADEGTQTMTWAAGDAHQRKETKVTLDAAGGGTITAGYTLAMDFTIVDASHTLTAESGWRVLLIWE